MEGTPTTQVLGTARLSSWRPEATQVTSDLGTHGALQEEPFEHSGFEMAVKGSEGAGLTTDRQ